MVSYQFHVVAFPFRPSMRALTKVIYLFSFEIPAIVLLKQFQAYTIGDTGVTGQYPPADFALKLFVVRRGDYQRLIREESYCSFRACRRLTHTRIRPCGSKALQLDLTLHAGARDVPEHGVHRVPRG